MVIVFVVLSYGLLATVKAEDNTIEGYTTYVGQNYLDYDYDPVARHDPKLADKNISKRRNLGGEGYDLTSPSVYYGTGYSHGKTTNRQGGVTFGGGGGGGAFSINPQLAAGVGLLGIVGAIGALGTIIQAQQITDIQNRENNLNSEIQKLRQEEATLTASIRLLNQNIQGLQNMQNTNTGKVKTNEDNIENSRTTFNTCANSVGNLCTFAQSINNNLGGLALSTVTQIPNAPTNANFQANGVTSTVVRAEFNRVIAALNAITPNPITCNTCNNIPSG